MVTTPLIIYKASAGSGKTFTLATEYIKLVVKNPQAYRKILAVTFTNKATEEMKMRILSQLYGIWKQLPSSKDYTEAVCKSLDASPEFVAKQAGLALSNLLHNYSYFRIDTIDSFFQTVLRNLAREVELTANLRVGLNDIQVEEMAVDELIDNLTSKDAMLQWILKYVLESISDDHSWNVIKQVKEFGRTIFKDYYKAESKKLYEALDEPKFFENYTEELRKKRANAKKRMTEIGDEFFRLTTEAGVGVDDFSYGKGGIFNFFQKLHDGTFDNGIIGPRIQSCAEDPENWVKKKGEKAETVRALANGPLGRLLDEALHEQPQQWKVYQSAELTLRHLNQLRLLKSIELKVRELNTDANRFLLSDTQKMLHDLIDNSDSPFIYEKIGTQLEHIMIDEFQDTSTVQWKNFKVLLQETMSHEDTENLIVGDVKQSIYRWRSGDWRLLGNITKEFDRPKEQLDIRTLDTNYRSSRRVIDFNNAFFIKATENTISAYDDVKQKVPAKRDNEGIVDITLLPSEDYQEMTLSHLVECVRQLTAQGVSSNQIAILVRTNKFIPLIADYFIAKMPEVTIVSDEAFRLDASSAVLVIIQALQLLTHPDDMIAQAFLAKAYAKKPLHAGNPEEMLPEAFSKHREELLRLPLYELTERLYSIFRLNEMEGQSAYLCAFYDQVTNYVNEQMADIHTFLKEWNETLCSKTIQSPDVNGIRLISIHKSKGLEFPYVLIPFCDWKLELGNILWCHPKEEPFNQLPIVPIDYSKSGMEGTVYEDDYNEENQQNLVDNMNLLYVAFTRASQGLYVWGKRGGSGHRSNIIETVLPSLKEDLKDMFIEGVENKKGPLHFEYGSVSVERQERTTETQGENDGNAPGKPVERNVFLQKATPLPLDIQVYDQKVSFKQSNKSREFAATDDEQQETNYIQLGSILHNVFSTILTKTDVDAALQQMEFEGIIYDKHLTRERIENLIRKRLNHPSVAEWYDEKWTLFNECTILNVDPKTGVVYERRPDRVMTDGKEMIVVDFKFGRKRDEYKDQVREYMQLLLSMGYPNVRGYLWYVYSNIIEEVK
ncbi:MAG: UvrD-helicase domain-containing protein [Prevotella sp.]|nr:UvrD-helicase domain-containing protein [Prevotella sp.]